MGKSTTIIANHTLDTSSLENLARAVSNRLQATIAYGYNSKFNYKPLKNKISITYNTTILGTIKHPNSLKNYLLFDAYFQCKDFIKI